MFRTRKTKIASTPVEEVLEVKEVVPQREELVAMDFARVEGSVKYIYYGSLVDYDGKEYEFEWDDSRKCLSRLAGSQVSQFSWDSATRVLEEQFKIPEQTIESKIEPIVVKEIGNLSITLTKGLQDLDNKVEKISRPVVQQTPKAEPEIQDVEEDIMMSNAIKYLQEVQDDDLGVDYLSL